MTCMCQRAKINMQACNELVARMWRACCMQACDKLVACKRVTNLLCSSMWQACCIQACDELVVFKHVTSLLCSSMWQACCMQACDELVVFKHVTTVLADGYCLMGAKNVLATTYTSCNPCRPSLAVVCLEERGYVHLVITSSLFVQGPYESCKWEEVHEVTVGKRQDVWQYSCPYCPM